MSNCKALSMPSTPIVKLSLSKSPPFRDPTLFRSIVGGLQYLTFTCPDISFAVNRIFQFVHCPTNLHWQATKCILRYLFGTVYHGLFLAKSTSLTLSVFSDADRGGSLDDHKSTSGYALYVGSNLVSWGSQK
ncbi:hypothetical protein ACH5RR_018694 [Cinchona calisaya]|uniref:Uncharacterized protein n=1 Tax=Cinchona calisaya TaxID=153742 RepID=A0ABD2ZQU0_9GENT